MPNNRRRQHKAFKQAAKIVVCAAAIANENRDTLFLTAVIAHSAHQVITGHPVPSVSTAFLFGAVREGIRLVGWIQKSSQPVIIGAKKPKYPPMTCARAAAAGAYASLSGSGLSVAVLFTGSKYLGAITPIIAIGAISTILGAYALNCANEAGGIKQTLKIYRDYMWNYPKKKDDNNGPPETKKVIGKITELMAGALGDLGGLAPSPQPAHVSQRRHSSCSPAPH